MCVSITTRIVVKLYNNITSKLYKRFISTSNLQAMTEFISKFVNRRFSLKLNRLLTVSSVDNWVNSRRLECSYNFQELQCMNKR